MEFRTCHRLPALPATLALLALIPLITPLPARAEPLYAVTLLPDGFQPADINNRGQIAGAFFISGGGVHAAWFGDGIITDLARFGTRDSYANAINDGGTIAGNFGGSSGTEHAFVFEGGTWRDLGAGTAAGMNALGDVVGQRMHAAGAAGFVYHDGVMTELAYLGSGNVSRATAINDAGQVVGESNLTHDAQVPTHPFLSEEGRMRDIGTLAGQGVNSAMAINNAGQVAGYSDAGDGKGTMHAFLYERGVMTDLGSFGGLDITIGGMNAWGQLVGTGNTPDGPDVAFLSRAGSLLNLDSLIDAATGWHITAALDINDNGQIIAYACRATECNAVRLDVADAVPEPDWFWRWLPGLLALVASRWSASGRHAG